MIKLTIKKSEESLYWTECFNDRESAERWLREERSRPYWQDTYTWKLDDIVDPPVLVDPAKERRREDRRTRLQNMNFPAVNTIAEIKTIVKDLIDERFDS